MKIDFNIYETTNQNIDSIMTPATHPLEPLTHSELQDAVEILRSAGHLSSNSVLIPSLVLKEPSKQLVFSWNGAVGNFPRKAVATLYDRTQNCCSKATICLRRRVVTTYDVIPGVQPIVTMLEFDECDEIVRNSAEFHAKILDHYGTSNPIAANLDNLVIEPWSAGFYGDHQEDEEKRLLKPICFFRDPDSGNPFAYPIEGLRPVVDLNLKRVIRIEDYGKWPLPPAHYDNHRADTMKEEMRKDIRPLDIVQKDGPSFKVFGRHVKWQKWSFVIGFNGREGLTLHDIRYDDRPILFRASVSEMVVPYGDPSPRHARKNAFDLGEYGMGFCTRSLKLGCDCLGEIKYFDWDLVSSTGTVTTQENVICMHEEDYGILWKHYDHESGSNEIRRSRRLVVSHFAAIGNYDYGFYWYFYQDGNIQLEVKLTGFLSLGAQKADDPQPKYGNLVAPQLYAPNHQHFFNFRLDFSVDGINNTVSQVDVVSESNGGSEEHPFSNAFYGLKTSYKTEKESLSSVETRTSRTWEICNEARKNQLGQPVAYKLIPGENTVPFASPSAFWRRRARFVDHHIWVTHFNEAELHSAGEFPNQAKEDTGLIQWIEKDRKIANEDCVLWYTFGITHIPRPEDYPIMPVVYCGFFLKPHGFFDRNPAFDVPPQCEINGPSSCGGEKARL